MLVVSVCLLCLGPSSAHAADELGISRDGRTWSNQLERSLFDSGLRWVPGDVRTSEFYVRNQAAVLGTLTISVESRDPDLLLRNGEMLIETRVGSRNWVALEHTANAYRMNQSSLAAGGTQKLRVRASFDRDSTNSTQRDHAEFRFTVTLADAGVGSGGDDPNGSGDHGLPDTGAPAWIGWLLVVAGVAIGSGLALLKRGKREDSGHGAAR